MIFLRTSVLQAKIQTEALNIIFPSRSNPLDFSFITPLQTFVPGRLPLKKTWSIPYSLLWLHPQILLTL